MLFKENTLKVLRNIRTVGFLFQPPLCLMLEKKFSSGSWFNLEVSKY